MQISLFCFRVCLFVLFGEAKMAFNATGCLKFKICSKQICFYFGPPYYTICAINNFTFTYFSAKSVSYTLFLNRKYTILGALCFIIIVVFCYMSIVGSLYNLLFYSYCKLLDIIHLLHSSLNFS